MKILAADDDVTSRLLLEAILSKWHYEVLVVKDGNEAWEVLQQENAPSLAILDWMMPGLSGADICRLASQRPGICHPYIILLTALGRTEDIVIGLEAGASDYLTKPFHSEELRARVEVGKRVVELQNDLAGQITKLEDALEHIKRLQGILPICMHCHKIRDDQESWRRLEEYIQAHSEAQFSHSLCPECLEKFYPGDDEPDA